MTTSKSEVGQADPSQKSGPRRKGRAQANDPHAPVIRIEVNATGVALRLPVPRLARLRPCLGSGEGADPDPEDPAQLWLTLPLRMRVCGGRTEVVGATGPQRRPDKTLIRALRTAHAMVTADRSGHSVLTALPEKSWQRRLIRLAFLAPDLQDPILEGRQPESVNLTALMEGEFPPA